MTGWVLVVAAIGAEVAAATVLAAPPQRHAQVARAAAVAMLAASQLLVFSAMRTLPLPIVYAVWSAGGAAGVALAAALVLRRRPDRPTAWGLALTVAGAVLVHAAHPGAR